MAAKVIYISTEAKLQKAINLMKETIKCRNENKLGANVQEMLKRQEQFLKEINAYK